MYCASTSRKIRGVAKCTITFYRFIPALLACAMAHTSAIILTTTRISYYPLAIILTVKPIDSAPQDHVSYRPHSDGNPDQWIADELEGRQNDGEMWVYDSTGTQYAFFLITEVSTPEVVASTHNRLSSLHLQALCLRTIPVVEASVATPNLSGKKACCFLTVGRLLHAESPNIFSVLEQKRICVFGIDSR